MTDKDIDGIGEWVEIADDDLTRLEIGIREVRDQLELHHHRVDRMLQRVTKLEKFIEDRDKPVVVD